MRAALVSRWFCAVVFALLAAGCNGGSSSPPPFAAPAGTNVASAAVSMAGFPILGQAGSFTVGVVARDAAGNIISGTFLNPVTLTNSDSSGATHLSGTSLASSSATVTLTYNGALLFVPAVIGATITGVPPASIAAVTFLPNADDPRVGGQVATYTSTTTRQSIVPPGAPTTSTSTSAETITGGVTFHGVSNLLDDRRVITIPGTTQTLDNYLSYVTVGTRATLVIVFATNSLTQTSGGGTTTDALTDTFTSPLPTLDIVPHGAGTTWDGRSAGTFTDHVVVSFPGSDEDVTTTGSFALDGSGTSSYTGTFSGSPGSGNSTLRADGSLLDSATIGGNTDVTTIGVPALSGGSMVIPVTQTHNGATTLSNNTPDWYPNPASPPVLRTFVVADDGIAAIPAACGLPAGAPTQATEIHQSVTSLSPLGSYQTVLSDLYVAPGVGEVCILQTSVSSRYAYTSTGALTQQLRFTSARTMTSGTLSRARRPLGAAPRTVSPLHVGLALLHAREPSQLTRDTKR